MGGNLRDPDHVVKRTKSCYGAAPMTPPFTEAELAETRRPLLEATQLPPRAYVDDEVADWEAEHLFLGGWMCVGHAQPLALRGAFYTRDIAGESFLFMGDEAGRAHGVFNV